MPVASDGPLLNTVSVKVAGSPATGVAGLTDLMIATSAELDTVIVSLASLFEGSPSFPPATVAVLVIELGAEGSTVTPTVMSGYDDPAASASLRVQVTVWVTMLHVQPAPDAAATGRDAGTVSVTVTSPELAVLPEFEAVSVKDDEPPCWKLPESVLASSRSGATTVNSVGGELVSVRPNDGLDCAE